MEIAPAMIGNHLQVSLALSLSLSLSPSFLHLSLSVSSPLPSLSLSEVILDSVRIDLRLQSSVTNVVTLWYSFNCFVLSTHSPALYSLFAPITHHTIVSRIPYY